MVIVIWVKTHEDHADKNVDADLITMLMIMMVVIGTDDIILDVAADVMLICCWWQFASFTLTWALNKYVIAWIPYVTQGHYNK